MNERNRKTAEYFGLLPRLTALEKDLLQIPGVVRDSLDEGCQKVIDIYQTVDRIRDVLWNLAQEEA